MKESPFQRTMRSKDAEKYLKKDHDSEDLSCLYLITVVILHHYERTFYDSLNKTCVSISFRQKKEAKKRWKNIWLVKLKYLTIKIKKKI